MEKKFSLVIPLLAKEDHIEEVLFDHHKGLLEAFGENSFEIILVINGDNKLDQEKKIINRSDISNVVEVRTIKEGLLEACGEHVCYTNGSYAPVSEVIKIFKYAQVDSSVLVKASRIHRESKTRERISFIYNMLVRAILKIPALDLNAAPKAISREVLNKIPKMPSDDGFFDVELMYWSFLNGVPIVEIPIKWEQRRGGFTNTNWKTLLRFAKGIFILKWNNFNNKDFWLK